MNGSKGIINRYLIITFFLALPSSFVFPIIVVFLLFRGLNLFQVCLPEIAYKIAIVLFEIPTGAFADTYGRRWSVLMSNLFLLLGFVTYYLSFKLSGFILAEAFLGISTAFKSGALDAWMVDELNKMGYKEIKSKIFAKRMQVALSATMIGGLAGAYLAKVKIVIPFLFAIFSSLIAFVATLIFMKENVFEDKKIGILKKISMGFRKIPVVMKQSIQYGLKKREVFLAITFSAILVFAFQVVNRYWQPLFKAHFDISFLGWVWVIISLCMIFGSSLSRYYLRIEKKMAGPLQSSLYGLLLAVIFMGISIVVAGSVSSYLATFLFFIIHEISRGFGGPLRTGYINQFIDSEIRATVLSFDSLVKSFFSIFGLLIAGWLSGFFSIKLSWLVSGFIILFSIFPVLLCLALLKKDKYEK